MDKFGMGFVSIGIEELLEEIGKKAYPENEYTALFKAQAFDKGEIEKALYVYGAFKRLVEKYDLCGVSVRCFDLLDTVSTTGCLGLSILNAEGIYDFVPIDNGSDVMPVIDLGGVVQQGVFDGTFDITFMAISGGGNPNRIRTIDIDRHHNEGIYLRWIDRHGFTAYWLFKVGDEQHTISQIIAASRANYATYRERYGFTGNAGERGAMQRVDVVPLCVPLVDKTTWEYLQDVASSPVVDMFAGMDSNNNPIWLQVSVQAATYTKTRDELQDFTINLLPPQTPIQRL